MENILNKYCLIEINFVLEFVNQDLDRIKIEI